MNRQVTDVRKPKWIAERPLVWVLLVSAACWALLFLVIPPDGQDFPLNDDWAFSLGAFQFARGQGIHYGRWAAMPQLGQWLWACPFIWLFGEHYWALRLSTIVLSWAALWAFDDLLRQGTGWSKARSAFVTAALALNPLFFLLQGSFMTDVPALSFSLLALALYVRAFAREHRGFLAAALAVAILGVITRQNTATVPVVAGMVLLRSPGLRWRGLWFGSVLLPIAVAVAVHWWVRGRADVLRVDPTFQPPVYTLLYPYLIVHFLGLSALPVIALEPRVGSWKAWLVAFVFLGMNACYWYHFGDQLVFRPGLYPYTSNMITPFGAFTENLVVGERPVLLGMMSRTVLTALGCFGGAFVLVRLLEWIFAGTPGHPLLLFGLVQIPLLLLAAPFDRYLLFLVPGGLYLTAARIRKRAEVGISEGAGRAYQKEYLGEKDAACPRKRGHGTGASAEQAGTRVAREARGESNPQTEFGNEQSQVRIGRTGLVIGCVILAIGGVISVGLMHDWLSWNSARWELGSRAVKSGVKPTDIEGGLEWDGCFSSRKQVQLQGMVEGHLRLPINLTQWPWFPDITGRYALSFSANIPGTEIVDQQRYAQWLLPGRWTFYLLKEKDR